MVKKMLMLIVVSSFITTHLATAMIKTHDFESHMHYAKSFDEEKQNTIIKDIIELIEERDETGFALLYKLASSDNQNQQAVASGVLNYFINHQPDAGKKIVYYLIASKRFLNKKHALDLQEASLNLERGLSDYSNILLVVQNVLVQSSQQEVVLDIIVDLLKNNIEWDRKYAIKVLNKITQKNNDETFKILKNFMGKSDEINLGAQSLVTSTINETVMMKIFDLTFNLPSSDIASKVFKEVDKIFYTENSEKIKNQAFLIMNKIIESCNKPYALLDIALYINDPFNEFYQMALKKYKTFNNDDASVLMLILDTADLAVAFLKKTTLSQEKIQEGLAILATILLDNNQDLVDQVKRNIEMKI